MCSGYCAFVVLLPYETVLTDTDAATTMTHRTPLGAVMMHRSYVPAQHRCLRMSIHVLAAFLGVAWCKRGGAAFGALPQPLPIALRLEMGYDSISDTSVLWLLRLCHTKRTFAAMVTHHHPLDAV